MRIRWENITPLLLLIVLTYLFLKMLPVLDMVVDGMASSSYEHQDPRYHLVVLGLLCLTVVAICKILSNRRR